MFPHTITIYHHDIVNGADVYNMQTIDDFYIYTSSGINKAGKGEVDADVFTAVCSPNKARTFGSEWFCDNNDRVIKGTGKPITSWRDIPDAKVVTSVKGSVIGSGVDNVTIKAR